MRNKTLIFNYITNASAKSILKEIKASSSHHIKRALKKYKIKYESINEISIRISPFHNGVLPYKHYLLLKSGEMEEQIGLMEMSILECLNTLYISNPGTDVHEQIKVKALQRIGHIANAFKENNVIDPSISVILDHYSKRLLSYDFTVKKYNEDHLNIDVVDISVEQSIDYKSLNQGELPPSQLPLFNMMVFHIRAEPIPASEMNNLHTFNWQSSEDNLKELHRYLEDNNLIKPMNYIEFKLVFNHVMVNSLQSKIVWIDLGKNLMPTVGNIVDFVWALSSEGFISSDYQQRKKSNEVIVSCFVLPDGSPVRVDNKKVTQYAKRTQKLKNFYDFLESLPSIPS